MAPADGLSAPGAVTYDSDTIHVGDGTWDFTKNTFLLPNLLGLNFETMQYNGMGNRFATVPQYHTIILAHGLLGALVFLLLVPVAVMQARFHPSHSRDTARKHHAALHVFSVLLITVVFTLGWFAVGPNRSWTNPHHAIGLTIYVLFLLQAIGGRMVRNIFKRSLRLMIHRWSGRALALLGIAQVPLGLTLYGSPKYTFILFALWMAFLVLVYFILSWRHDGRHHDTALLDGRQQHHYHEDGTSVATGHKKKSGLGWIAPLAAGAGIFALMKGRKRHGSVSSRSNSPSRSGRHPEVIPSRRGSASYFDDEKHSERTDHRRKDSGVMGKLLGVAGVIGAGALVKNYMDRRDKRKFRDEEYSAVATDTPSRPHPITPSRFSRRHTDPYTESEFTEDRTQLNRPITPLLPGPGDPVVAAAAISAAERPSTPRPVRPPHARPDSFYSTEYSSYVSPSRRTRVDDHSGAAGKGLLAALGLGWFSKKVKDRRDRRAEEERMRVEDERRDGRHGSRFTGDGYGTPTRPSRRRPPPAVAQTATSITQDSESSMVESRPPGTGAAGPPMPPLGHNGTHPAIPPAGSSVVIPAPIPVPISGSRRHSRSGSRRDGSKTRPETATTRPDTATTRPETATTGVAMPAMPSDPQGLLAGLRHESESEAYTSAGGRPSRRHSSRRRREGEAAAVAAAASAGHLAANEERRHRSHSRAPSKPVSVKVKYHDDRDRNVTLRRLTDEEAAAARRERRRARSDSMSSLSESEAPGSGRGRYRRTSSARRGKGDTAELLPPLSPPTPAFAGGRKRQKDSAYYSGQPGPSGEPPAAAQTVSSIDSSHGTWSALSPSPSGPAGGRTEGSVPASAADRRRRRRLERQESRPPGTVDYS